MKNYENSPNEWNYDETGWEPETIWPWGVVVMRPRGAADLGDSNELVAKSKVAVTANDLPEAAGRARQLAR